MTDLRPLEDRVTEVLRRQAEGLDVPARPELDSALVSLPAARRRLRRWPVAALSAAAALAVVVALVANLGARPADRLTTQPADEGAGTTTTVPTTTVPTTTVPVPPGALKFATGQVSMIVAELVIEAGGERFVTAGPVTTHSDPGVLNAYTTLELTWTEHGREMRLFLYFMSDGVDWWANEIRTYDGAPRGSWVSYIGEFFRTPLGRPFTGDVDMDAPDGTARLQLSGLRLQAFLRPASCDTATGAYALELPASSILVRGGYGISATLLDAATCTVASPNTAIAFEWRSDDTSVVTVRPDGKRADLSSAGAGRTRVHVLARDRTSGQVVAEASVDVESDPAGPPQPLPVATTLPRITG